MDIINVTFANTVRSPNLKNENFLASDKFTSLSWHDGKDALVVRQEGKKQVVLVFKTNISHMTVEGLDESNPKIRTTTK